MKAGSRWIDPSHVAGLLLLACAFMSRAANAPDLEGTKWILATLGGRSPLAHSIISLEFTGGRIQGSDGCNHYNGPYRASGSELRIGPKVASTMISCPPELMQQAGYSWMRCWVHSPTGRPTASCNCATRKTESSQRLLSNRGRYRESDG